MSQMKEAFNMIIAGEFKPSWNNVRNESMMGCFNKYVCGFMYIQFKPHPFGNERDTICCGKLIFCEDHRQWK